MGGMKTHVVVDGDGSSPSTIDATVRTFISDVFIFDNQPTDLPGHVSLMKSGVVDSMGVLELILFLEETYGMELSEAEMTPANLDTIDGIVALICANTGAADGRASRAS